MLTLWWHMAVREKVHAKIIHVCCCQTILQLQIGAEFSLMKRIAKGLHEKCHLDLPLKAEL
jgi:hypothetical protein